MRGCGWALRKMSSPASGAGIYLLPAQPARREWKLSASATGSPNSSTSHLQFRTTLAANRFAEKLLWWTPVTPFRKLQTVRLGHTVQVATSYFAHPARLEPH